MSGIKQAIPFILQQSDRDRHQLRELTDDELGLVSGASQLAGTCASVTPNGDGGCEEDYDGPNLC